MNSRRLFSRFACSVIATAACVGIASAASPVDVDGLTLWLDANDFAKYPTGTKVPSWTDKASSLPFTQGTDSVRPTVNKEGPNNKTVVHFERPNPGNPKQTQYLECQNNTLKTLFQAPHTSFAVARGTAAGGNGGKENATYVYALPGYHSGLQFWADGGNNLVPPTQAGAIRWLSNSSGGNVDGNFDLRASYTAGEYIMLSAVVNGYSYNTPGVSLDVFINNEPVNSGSNAGKYLYKQTSECALVRIGASNNSADWSGGLNGDIAEILVFNRVLSEAEQRTVWKYLANKWGLVGFAIGNPVTHSPLYISSGTVSIISHPEIVEGMEYQLSLEAEADNLSEADWMASSTPFPETYSFPTPAEDGDVTIYLWTRTTGENAGTNSAPATIAYTTVAPTAVAKDISIAIDSVTGYPLSASEIDNGSSDATGIYSLSVDPGVIRFATNVTLTVMNNAGLASTATAHVSISSLLDIHVETDGNDGLGDGSAGSPFATISHAIDVANNANDGNFRTVYVGEGTFSAASGEVFPYTVSNNVAIAGSGIGRTIVDGNRTGNFMNLVASTTPSRIAGLSLRRAQRYAINAESWGGVIEDCEISDISNTYNFIFVNEASARDFTLSGLVVTNITGSTSSKQLMDLRGATGGLLTITNCFFDNISTPNAAWQHGGNIRIMGSIKVQTAGWNSEVVDTVFANFTAPGGNHGEGSCIMYGKTADYGYHRIDRCVFHDIDFTNNGEVFIGGDNANATGQTLEICNSLFYNIHFKNNGPSYTSSAVGGFRVAPIVYNCTFHNVDTVVRPFTGSALKVYNSSISDCAHLAMANNPTTYVYLNNVNVCNTGDASNYSAANSSNVTSYDPYYKNASSANFKLKPLSLLVDAGNNANVQGANDLAHGVRIADGNADGTATVDIGAYEYDPSAAGARFVAGAAVYGVFEGKSVAIPVWIEPAMARDPITANVACPAGITGAATLSFTTGLETNHLVVTAADPLDVPNGTLLELGISDADEDLDSTSIGLMVNTREVSIPGLAPRVFLRDGESASFTPQLPNEFFAAPETIAITAGSQAGDIGNTISWNGTGIAAGTNAADGTLSLVSGGTGRTTLDLCLPSGWTFAGSGEDTLAIEVVGFEPPLYISPDGSDATGEGTEDSPLRTMTYATPLLRAGETLRLLPGVYGPTDAEVFPVTVPPGIALVGERGAGDAPETTAIIDPDATGNAFVLGTLGADQGNIPGGALRSLVIRNAAGTGIYGRFWGGDITDCALRDFAPGTFLGSCSALYINPSRGNVVLSGTEIGCITSSMSVVAYVESGNGSLTVTNCWFHDLKGTGETAWEHTGGMFNSRVPVTVMDSVFEDIVMPGNGGSESMGVLHAYNVHAEYHRNIFRRIAIHEYHFNYALLAGNRDTPLVANCLFHDITSAGTRQVLGGYSATFNVVNCTFDNIPALFSSYDVKGRTLRNSSVSHCDAINLGEQGTTQVVLKNVNLYDVGEGTGFATNLSENVTFVDPGYKNPGAGNYHLRSSSALVNAGDNTLVVGTTDLDGNDRIFRADKGGIVDLGCYENSTLGGTVFLLR
ncbi:MAG: DUF1565 domain-containing protein [Kiritimatiellia bacterium]